MHYSDREIKMFEIWDYMEDNEIASAHEISVAIYFSGRNLETFESLLFFKTGCRTLEQIRGELGE